MKRTYLDHASTSPILPEVAGGMGGHLTLPLNASSVHTEGQRARALLEGAREEVADALGLPPAEVVFTSGASESNNLAIRGFAEARRALARPLLIALSALEHSCVREACTALETTGRAELRWLPVTSEGQTVPPRELGQDSGGQPVPDLLCLMAVQNETGVIQPLDEARRWRNETGCLWLCDATQAIAVREEPLAAIGADLVSLSSHKIGGPPGVGVLAGPGIGQLLPQISGGPQEGEKRAGTQPVAAICGFALAVRLARERAGGHLRHLSALEDALLSGLRRRAVPFSINGEGVPRVSGFLNLAFPGFSGADLVIALDGLGFAVSSGSACATGVMETSPVLEAMFPGDPERASAAVRITPGSATTIEDMERLADALAGLVLRESGRGRAPGRATRP